MGKIIVRKNKDVLIKDIVTSNLIQSATYTIDDEAADEIDRREYYCTSTLERERHMFYFSAPVNKILPSAFELKYNQDINIISSHENFIRAIIPLIIVDHEMTTCPICNQPLLFLRPHTLCSNIECIKNADIEMAYCLKLRRLALGMSTSVLLNFVKEAFVYYKEHPLFLDDPILTTTDAINGVPSLIQVIDFIILMLHRTSDHALPSSMEYADVESFANGLRNISYIDFIRAAVYIIFADEREIQPFRDLGSLFTWMEHDFIPPDGLTAISDHVLNTNSRLMSIIRGLN